MPIFIYNSLTRSKEEFIPLEPSKVNIYTCGVTVYDNCHIGHARSLYIFDLIRRYLKYKGFDVRFVRNITDIDDKIINRANELKVDWQELVKKYIGRYYEDIAALGIEKADAEPCATEPGNIAEMIKHIEALINKGYAYITDSGVYFSVRCFSGYGKLSGQGIDQMLSGVRIESDEKKQDPLDFALWKRSKPDEPYWGSPWGRGRPGWHIECSVMSMKYLEVQTLDIHAGGRDLIFPHHENEIAQVEALTGKPFAKYWIHHGLLTINTRKMAKSLGNFITIQKFIDKYHEADLLKLFFLSAHYSQVLDYSDEKIVETNNALQRFKVLFKKAQGIIDNPPKPGIGLSAERPDFIEKHRNKFLEAMDDDFNTARALSHLFDLVNDTNKFIDAEERKPNYVSVIKAAQEAVFELGKKIFGLFSNLSAKPLTAEETELIKKREDARVNKDFAVSDELREALRKRGIIVEDTKDGQTWRRA